MWYAGSKGVEPLIEVLETSVIPFNYEPNGYHFISCCHAIKPHVYGGSLLAKEGHFVYHRQIMQIERAIGFSTDVLGAIWTDPTQFGRVVPFAEFPSVKHAELVGIGGKDRLIALANGLRAQGVTPIQLHGRMGGSGNEPWYDQIKIWGIERFLPQPDAATDIFPDLDIVLHVPAVQRLLDVGRVQRNMTASMTPRWLVENHDPGLGGVTEAIALSGRLNDRGILSEVLVDVGHATRRLQKKAFNDSWTTMTKYLARMTEQPGAKITALHIPIGTNLDDSLPESLTQSHRRDLVNSLGPSVRRIIFEYQRSGLFGLLHMFEREEQKERRRISTQFAGWGSAGLFSS